VSDRPINPFGGWPDPPVDDHSDVPPPDGLRAVVEASAREPHADVVLHALHVSGGAAALASVEAVSRKAALRSILKAAVEALGLEFDETPASPLYLTASVAREDEVDAAVFKVRIPLYVLRDLKRKAEDDPPGPRPANVAAFVLKAPALDRLLLVRSGKPGRAWELPGGAREPGEGAWRAVVREVAEESGAEFIHDGLARSVEGCVVFYGTSATHVLAPGDDAVEAQWFDKSEVAALQLSDLPTAVVIRGWGESRA
jgi:ADP-ribose pyrophosphatase YjhB (NUDIX family)